MTAPPPTVRILVGGAGDRGDEGAPLIAIARVLPALDASIRQFLEVRRCRELGPGDLVDIRPGAACLVLDTVSGIEPGRVVDLPLDTIANDDEIQPRSVHGRSLRQLLDAAAEIRGDVPPGRFLGIGGKWFGFGTTRSRALRSGMPAFETALEAAIARLAAPAAVGTTGSG